MAHEAIENLHANALYDTAMEEVVSFMPPVRETIHWPNHAVRELCIAAWLRGATWQRERDAERTSGAKP
jgi:hypothetical protein